MSQTTRSAGSTDGRLTTAHHAELLRAVDG